MSKRKAAPPATPGWRVELQPRAFVAENVKGLVIGQAKGYAKEILRRLRACGYRVACRLLDAQWLGTPQTRERAIFVGFHEDLGIEPVHPKPFPWRFTLRDACPWLVAQTVGNDAFRPRFGGVDVPHPTILAQGPRTSGFVAGPLSPGAP